ncbi:PD-(D/E)XK nuclease family protein [Macrococcus sp. DPC7161]|uniref:PD-(D/E)XK nuclease family protein n=1 Tax=Macrococcus sp. DPC7161 TaxID=2507060 RepID=UPI00100ACC96|nr:PD-(D/E)XK nuclease family protein [Macrococcus sp. DPC7161]RXK18737.1 hypothetical protein ER639_00065 [Macrococcus sp. DPC7161]
MSVQIVQGRRGVGKTYEVIQMIKEMLKTPLGKPIIYIAPRQSTFSIEQAFANDPEIKGSMRVAIYSLDRLYHRLVMESGSNDLMPLSSSGLEMMIYYLLNHNKTELKRFEKSSHYYGFSQKMAQTISEFKKYHVDLEQLKQVLASDQLPVSTKDKLQDISFIYELLENEIKSQFKLKEDTYLELIELIEKSPLMQDATVIVDGFYNFTTIEYAVLRQIACVSEMHLLLTNDESEPSLFRKTNETHRLLLETFKGLEIKETTIQKQPKRFKTSDLSHLESQFNKLMPTKQKSDQSIQLIQADQFEEEIQQMMFEIHQMTQNGTYRYKEINILYRDERYAKALIQASQKHDIPYHTDYQSQMKHHHLVGFLTGLLNFIEKPYINEYLFKALKTGLLFPFDRLDEMMVKVDTLENFMIERGLTYKDLVENNRLQIYQSQLNHKNDDTKAHIVKSHEDLMKFISMITSRITPLLDALKSTVSATAFATNLYEWLEHEQVLAHIKDEQMHFKESGQLYKALENDQLVSGLNRVLDEFVAVLNDKEMTYSTFKEVIIVGLDALKFNALPQGLDQIKILNLDLAKIENAAVVFVCGFNDGILPRPTQMNPMITDQEKIQLAPYFNLAPTSEHLTEDEAFVAYTALTNARERLYISYCGQINGEAMTPSIYLNHIIEMFDSIHIIQTALIEDPKAKINHIAANVQQVVEHFEHESWQPIVKYYAQIPKYRSIFTLNHYQNLAKPLDKQYIKSLYGDQIKASVSRFETFNQCPFKYYAQYGIQLKKREPFQLKASTLGSIFHELLSDLTDKYQKMIKNPDEIDQYVDAYFEQHQKEIEFAVLSSSQYHLNYIKTQIKRIIKKSFMMINTQQTNSHFENFGTEIDFEYLLKPKKNKFHSPKVTTNNGIDIYLSGTIDRVDLFKTDNKTYVNVIDYKSSDTDLDLKKVYYGIQMQLITYLDIALQNKTKMAIETELLPSGMLYFHVKSSQNKFSNFKDYQSFMKNIKESKVETILNTPINHYLHKGLFVNDVSVVQSLDTQLEETNQPMNISAKITQNKEGVKINGQYKNNFIEQQDFYQLIHKNKENIKKTAEHIYEGHIEVAPIEYGKKRPCTFCEFKPVCHIDPIINKQDIRVLDEKIDVRQLLERGEL